MIENVLAKIVESEEGFFELWTQRMQKSGYLMYISAKRNDFHNAFAWLVNFVLTFASEHPIQQVFRFRDMSPHCRFILEEARLHRSRGGALEQFLGSFKIMVQALEDSILGLDSSEGEINTALLAVRRCVDILETTVVQDWEDSEKSQEFKDLELAYRRLLLEKKNL